MVSSIIPCGSSDAIMARVATDLTITPLHPHLGARIEGVGLAGPLDEGTLRRIFDAFQEYSILVFHDQVLTDEGPTADPPIATRVPVWDGIVPAG